MFHSPSSRYNIIIGRDILGHGFILNHACNIVTWGGLSIPIQESSSTSSTINTNFSCSRPALAVYAAATIPILKAKYKCSLPGGVVCTYTHLTPLQQSKLLTVLNTFSRLFTGKLGRYIHNKFSFKVKDPKILPIFCNPYPVPLVHQKAFKQELQHLINEKVLQQFFQSEWAFPTFLILKNDDRVYWISYFRHLTKLLRRAKYFLPNIPAMTQKELA